MNLEPEQKPSSWSCYGPLLQHSDKCGNTAVTHIKLWSHSQWLCLLFLVSLAAAHSAPCLLHPNSLLRVSSSSLRTLQWWQGIVWVHVISSVSGMINIRILPMILRIWCEIIMLKTIYIHLPFFPEHSSHSLYVCAVESYYYLSIHAYVVRISENLTDLRGECIHY